MKTILLIFLIIINSIHSKDIFTRTKVMKMVLKVKNYLMIEQVERAKLEIESAYQLDSDDSEVKYYYDMLSYPNIELSGEDDVFMIKEKKEFKLLIKVDESRRSWVKSWTLVFKNESKDIVSTLKGSELPEFIIWNGLNDSKQILPRANYTVELTAVGELGFPITSNQESIFLTDIKLEGQISIHETSFNPGKSDIVVHLTHPDRKLVSDWELKITNNSGKVIRNILGKGPLPETIPWDNKDNSGNLVPDCDIFTVVLSGKNKTGTTWDSNTDLIESEIEIINIDGKLKFKMSTLQFAIGKSDLNPSSINLLERVTKLLKKYNWYDVEVSGHTDNTGNPEGNLELSKRRAETVKNYFIQSAGLPDKRFTSLGKGRTEPIADNNTDYGRSRNRRVEFILTESKK